MTNDLESEVFAVFIDLAQHQHLIGWVQGQMADAPSWNKKEPELWVGLSQKEEPSHSWCCPWLTASQSS